MLKNNRCDPNRCDGINFVYDYTFMNIHLTSGNRIQALTTKAYEPVSPFLKYTNYQ